MPSCPKCGTALGAYGPAGLCPKCMFLDGLGSDDARHFGDYELIEEIARGGMGVVWRGRQLSLNRIVAVKLLLAGAFASPDHLRRFRAEAEAAASLQHPNIVAIHEIGERDGQPFFSMDFVAGPNLAEIVRDHPLPPTQAAGYLKTIAEAVHYAHQRGVLHRDLKPSNILIDPLDQPRITDFGLAKRLAVDTDLTLSGQILGSPNFLPPEQAEGRHKEVGPPSDIYSLGAVLYCLLTGRAPFQAATVADTLKQVSTADPVAPRLLNPSVPRDLETTCLKCLEKEPSRRYASAQELADELGRFLRAEPIRARRLSAAERGWRWCRRKPVVAGLIAGLSLALLLGFAGVTWQWRRAQAGETRAARNLYAADINLAGQAFAENNRGRALELLNRHRPQPREEDRRGWEWRYLWQRCRSAELATLGDFPSAVTGVAFSPDGRWLASGSKDGFVKLWPPRPAPTPRESLRFPATTNLAPLALELGPDGADLAVWQPDGTVELWTTSTLERHRTVQIPSSLIAGVSAAESASDFLPRFSACAITRGGTRVAVGSADGSLRLLDTASAKEALLWTRSIHERPAQFPSNQTQPDAVGTRISKLTFSPDGRLLISTSEDHTIRVWDVATGDQRYQSAGPSRWHFTLAISPDGTRAAAGTEEGTIEW